MPFQTRSLSHFLISFNNNNNNCLIVYGQSDEIYKRLRRRTWPVMPVSVEGRRAGDQTEGRHVRHVRSQSAERGCMLGSARDTSVATSAIGSAASATSATRNQIGISPVTRAPSFPSISVDGRLQFVGRTVLFLLALVRIQVFHVPWNQIEIGGKLITQSRPIIGPDEDVGKTSCKTPRKAHGKRRNEGGLTCDCRLSSSFSSLP